MVGIASAYFLFPAFYSETDTNAWLNVYLLLCGGIVVSFLFLILSNVQIPASTAGANWREDLKSSFSLIAVPLVLVFICSAFFFVMIEQGIMTWLPRFNEKIFSFSEKLSVQMASLLAISLAVGRFVAGWLSKKFPGRLLSLAVRCCLSPCCSLYCHSSILLRLLPGWPAF
ncbi:MFS transporter [Niabella hibiscisoli]|uniref:MFS transporter n=1 Tax=Niabella hibiscisoli TaxID=1825928 RepID=UPI001F0E53E8|nr:MFS transporter [Niabella hibiscisoli]MCH5715195.1 MFS transporter [Niabella hibiscisoli]